MFGSACTSILNLSLAHTVGLFFSVRIWKYSGKFVIRRRCRFVSRAQTNNCAAKAQAKALYVLIRYTNMIKSTWTQWHLVHEQQDKHAPIRIAEHWTRRWAERKKKRSKSPNEWALVDCCGARFHRNIDWEMSNDAIRYDSSVHCLDTERGFIFHCFPQRGRVATK